MGIRFSIFSDCRGFDFSLLEEFINIFIDILIP